MRVFKTKEEIRKALLEISSLDKKQRDKVYNELHAELDGGGVDKHEFRQILSDLRRENEISDIDRKNLLDLLD